MKYKNIGTRAFKVLGKIVKPGEEIDASEAKINHKSFKETGKSEKPTEKNKES